MRALRFSSVLVFAAAVLGQEPAPEGKPSKPDFVKDVAPILVQRCVECHGPKEQKADLRLDRREHVLGEDPSTWLVIAGKPDESELLRRVSLPPEDDEIMPNKGEPLRKEQVAVLRAWIATGAEWPAAGDEFFAEAEAAMVVPRIDFGIAAPDAEAGARIDEALRRLAARGVVAQRVAADTPAVDVNASLLGPAFTDRDLELLSGLEGVLVWLNLARTAVTDEGLARLAAFGQLRRLNLAGTKLGDAGLRHLGPLARLEVLNVYGTGATDAALQGLAALPALRQLYAFETAIGAEAVRRLAERRPELAIDRGDYVAARLEQATQEIAERERERAEREAAEKAAAAARAPHNERCPVADKPVDAATTIEHDGLRIAFCCQKCKAAFEKEPAKFAAAIARIKAAQESKQGGGGAEGEPKKE